METLDIGQQLVAFSNDARSDLALNELYADDIVSVEGDGATSEGLAAVREKHAWWDANHDVHSAVAKGPFVGARADQFVVEFAIDLTERGGARQQMEELGVYTVQNGQIVREEFLGLR